VILLPPIIYARTTYCIIFVSVGKYAVGLVMMCATNRALEKHPPDSTMFCVTLSG
jgi:hypothetical protein